MPIRKPVNKLLEVKKSTVRIIISANSSLDLYSPSEQENIYLNPRVRVAQEGQS